MADNQECFDMALEIDACGKYLNSREQDFIEQVMGMSEVGSQLSDKQREWVQTIWDKTVGA